MINSIGTRNTLHVISSDMVIVILVTVACIHDLLISFGFSCNEGLYMCGKLINKDVFDGAH